MQWVEASLQPYDSLKEEAEALARGAREAALATFSSMERLLQAERLRKGMPAKRERVQLAGLAHGSYRPGIAARRRRRRDFC